MLAFAGAQIGLESARPQRPGEDKPGPGAAADQQSPPADPLLSPPRAMPA